MFKMRCHGSIYADNLFKFSGNFPNILVFLFLLIYHLVLTLIAIMFLLSDLGPNIHTGIYVYTGLPHYNAIFGVH